MGEQQRRDQQAGADDAPPPTLAGMPKPRNRSRAHVDFAVHRPRRHFAASTRTGVLRTRSYPAGAPG